MAGAVIDVLRIGEGVISDCRASCDGESAKPSKRPCSASTFAACMNPPHAARASAPPTLMRRTPSAAISATESGLAEPDEQIEGLGGYALDHAPDVLGRANTRRVEAIRARAGVRLQPRDRLVEVGPAHQEALRPSHQQGVAAGAIDRFARRTHARHRFIQRRTAAWRHRPSNPRSRVPPPLSRPRADTLSETPSGSRAWPLSKSALIGRSVAATIVRKCSSTASSPNAPSAGSQRPRGTRARRRKRLEPEDLQIACAAGVPGVRYARSSHCDAAHGSGGAYRQRSVGWRTWLDLRWRAGHDTVIHPTYRAMGNLQT